MRVNHLNVARADRAGHLPADAEVAPGTPAEAHEIDAFGNEFFADAADRVEAKDRRRDAVAQAPNGLAHEHFGPGHLHQVNDERDPQLPHYCDTATGLGMAGYGYGSVSCGNPDGDGSSFAATARVIACNCTASRITM